MRMPLFTNPDRYLKIRRGSGIFGFFKRRGEQWTLDRCLATIPDIRIVCDAPCGPGHLFSYWHRKGFQVIGVDLSRPMVTAANAELRKLNLNGQVLYGDVFNLPKLLGETPDLVASIRFIYYFDESQRIELLRTIASVSNRYVLTQYKTMDTVRGQITLRMSNKQANFSKQFCSMHQIVKELNEAELIRIRVLPISQFSDRVFVLAQKRVVKYLS